MVLAAWLVMDQVVFMDVSQWLKVVTMTPRPWTQTLAMINVDHEHTTMRKTSHVGDSQNTGRLGVPKFFYFFLSNLLGFLVAMVLFAFK